MHWTLCNNDCFQLFENLFILSQKTIPHKRWLKLHQKKMRVLCFVWRKGYVHICLQLVVLPLFTILLEAFDFSILLLMLQLKISLFAVLFMPTSETDLYCNYISVLRFLHLGHTGWPINLFIFRLRCSCSDWLEKKNHICYTLNFITYSCIPYRIPILWMELQLWRRMKWMHGFLIPVQNAGKL